MPKSRAGLSYLDEGDKQDHSFEVTISLTQRMLLAAKQKGQSPKDWVESTLAAQMSADNSVAYRKTRGNEQTRAVNARLPKESETVLQDKARLSNASVSLVASSLVEAFLVAHNNTAAKLPDFEAPPAGRIRPKDKDRMEALRKTLARVQLRLSESDIERLGDLAYAARRSRGDYIGSILMHQLDK